MTNTARAIRLAATGLLLACALAVGCTSQPKDEASSRRRGPRIGQLASRIEMSRENRPYGPVRLFATAVRLELPLDQSTDPAWELVDDTSLPPVLNSAWKANGLRIGLLDESNLEQFEQALPDINRMSRATIINRLGKLYPIHLSPQVARPMQVDLTVPPHVANVLTLREGRCQLLVRLMHDEGMPDVLELIPHHHVAKHSIVPRPMHEEALDGRIFEELSLTVPLRQDSLVVIGLHRPFPRVEEDGDEATERRGDEGEDAEDGTKEPGPSVPVPPDAEESDQATQPPSDERGANDQGDASDEETEKQDDQAGDDPDLEPRAPSPDPPPRFGPPPPFGAHLGRQFFAGRRDAKDVQLLLMLRVDMLESNLPQVDTAKRR